MIANPDTESCTTCKQTKHGGIHCSCGRVYCCDSKCIPEHYCPKGISQRQDIDLCPACEDELLAELKKDKKAEELNSFYGCWY